MAREQATGLIRITKTPHGDAPEWVRKAWIGLTLPAYPVAGRLAAPGLVYGALSYKVQDDVDYFYVPQTEALERLSGKDALAAEWWSRKGFPSAITPLFTFRCEEAEIVSGVRLQQVVEVTDEMMGDPNR